MTSNSNSHQNSLQHRKKRLDIQGLRTLAIMAVVPFHITLGNENKLFFYNGSFGVDIFFLISGYLMAQILSAKPINCQNLMDFYFRRIQRIVPIHCIFLLITIIFAQIVLPPKEFMDIRMDYLFGLGFAMNIEYSIYGPSDRVSLLHLWSLGVEMQFYLFAPFIVATIGCLAGRCENEKHGNWIKLLCLTLLTVPSFLAQHLISNTALAFASLHCRLWQFTFGMAVFVAAKMAVKADGNLLFTNEIDPNFGPNSPNTYKWRHRLMAFFSHFCTLLLVALLILVPIRDRTLRIFLIKMPMLLITAVLLGFHAITEENIQSILLTNRIMVHFGDISYILYLVHFPIVQLTKFYFNIEHYGLIYGLAVFVASILASELLHWLIDSHLRAIKSRELVVKLLVCLYILCGLVLLPTYFSPQILISASN